MFLHHPSLVVLILVSLIIFTKIYIQNGMESDVEYIALLFTNDVERLQVEERKYRIQF